jgi:hypothetical protein
MSQAQWNHGYNKGVDKGQIIGERICEAMTLSDLGMKALCLATAVRDAQKKDTVAQYVLMEVLLDFLGDQVGGRMNYPTQTAYAAMDGVSCRRLTPSAWLVPSQKYPS